MSDFSIDIRRIGECYIQCRKGYTLIESLIVIVVGLAICELSLGLYKIMLSEEDTLELNQILIFDVQIRQLLVRSGGVSIGWDTITFSFNNQEFVIEKDGDRLVKRPGYEILLYDVTRFEMGVVCNVHTCIEIKTR